jgi:thiol-disulfide isomerase/thioredoxin
MKLSAAVNKAADKVLDANPNEKDLKTIIALRMRIPMDPEAYKPYAEKLTKIGAELTKSGKAELGREITSVSYLVKINAAGEEPEPFKKAIDEALAYFGESKLEKADLMFVMSIAQMLESFPDDKFVGDSLEKIVKYLSDSKIEDVDKIVKQLEGTLRRMKLVGNKIELEGNLLSGDKLDLTKYKGKVYLVDFWATWCGPCVAEVPNMKKNYEAYHDKGFEIIGLSCDKSQDVIENFVKEKEIPWAIVYGDKAPSPSFEYYGISGIPTMILVGKDGKVISTTARGEELDKLLEKELGPAEKKEKKDDKKLQLKKEKKPAEKATK